MSQAPTYVLTVYRRKRVPSRRLVATGSDSQVRAEAARLLAWEGARRVTIRTPGGRYLPPVLKTAPAGPGSPATALFQPDPPPVPNSDPPAPAGV